MASRHMHAAHGLAHGTHNEIKTKIKSTTKQKRRKQICFHLFVPDNIWAGSYTCRAFVSSTLPPISCADGPGRADMFEKLANRAAPGGVEFQCNGLCRAAAHRLKI